MTEHHCPKHGVEDCAMDTTDKPWYETLKHSCQADSESDRYFGNFTKTGKALVHRGRKA